MCKVVFRLEDGVESCLSFSFSETSSEVTGAIKAMVDVVLAFLCFAPFWSMELRMF